jgi:hypothetical protein
LLANDPSRPMLQFVIVELRDHKATEAHRN